MFFVAVLAQGLPVTGVENHRQQQFDWYAVVSLCRGLATPLAGMVSLFKYGLRPLLHLSVSVQPSGDGLNSTLPVHGTFTNKIFRNPFAFAATRAEEVFTSAYIPGRDAFLRPALSAPNDWLVHIPTTGEGPIAGATTEAIRLAVPGSRSTWHEGLSTVGTFDRGQCLSGHPVPPMRLYHVSTTKGILSWQK